MNAMAEIAVPSAHEMNEEYRASFKNTEEQAAMDALQLQEAASASYLPARDIPCAASRSEPNFRMALRKTGYYETSYDLRRQRGVAPISISGAQFGPLPAAFGTRMTTHAQNSPVCERKGEDQHGIAAPPFAPLPSDFLC